MDELISSLKLNVSQKAKTKHYFKTLNLVSNFDVENSDDELSEEEEEEEEKEELAFTTERVQNCSKGEKEQEGTTSKETSNKEKPLGKSNALNTTSLAISSLSFLS